MHHCTVVAEQQKLRILPAFNILAGIPGLEIPQSRITALRDWKMAPGLQFAISSTEVLKVFTVGLIQLHSYTATKVGRAPAALNFAADTSWDTHWIGQDYIYMRRKLIVLVSDINNPPPVWSPWPIRVPTCLSSEIQCSWCSINLDRESDESRWYYLNCD